MRARLVLAVVLVAGCGGELTREEYVREAEAICTDAQRDLAELDRQDLRPAEEGPRAARIGDRQVQGLLDLEPPESLAPQAARFEELVEEVREAIRRADAGKDPDRQLDTIRSKGAEAARVLGEMGLRRCADDPNVDP